MLESRREEKTSSDKDRTNLYVLVVLNWEGGCFFLPWLACFLVVFVLFLWSVRVYVFIFAVVVFFLWMEEFFLFGFFLRLLLSFTVNLFCLKCIILVWCFGAILFPSVGSMCALRNCYM